MEPVGQMQPLRAQHSSALILQERGTYHADLGCPGSCPLRSSTPIEEEPRGMYQGNSDSAAVSLCGPGFNRFLFYSNQVRVGTLASTIAWCYLLPAGSSQCPYLVHTNCGRT